MKGKRKQKKLLEEIYSKYGAKIYNYAYYSIYSQEDAQDITQEAFLKFAEAVQKGTDIKNPEAYLYRTARNLIINRSKKMGREISEEDYPIDIVKEDKLYADPERAALLSEQREQVLSATRHLSEEQRTGLILKEVEGLGYEEIAEILDSNPNAVGALLSRGRLRFREELRMSQIDKSSFEEECNELLPLLSPYLDGRLSEEESQNIRQHLEKCPMCRLALDDMKEASISYRAMVPLLPIPALKLAILGGSAGTATGAGVTAGSTIGAGAATAATGMSVGIKIAIGVITGALVVGGSVGGYVGVKAVVSEDQPAVEEVKERRAKIAYLKDGDIHYCELKDEEIIDQGVLVDVPEDIDYFDVGDQGRKLVYFLEEPNQDPDNIGLDTEKTYFIYDLSSDTTDICNISIEHPFMWHLPYLSDGEDIWFNLSGGGPGASLQKYSIENGTLTFMLGGWLFDINPYNNRCIVVRHEYYPESGSYDEIYIVDINGNIIKDFGGLLCGRQQMAEIIPYKWSYRGNYILCERRIGYEGGVDIYSNEIIILDNEFNTYYSYTVPDETQLNSDEKLDVSLGNFDYDEDNEGLIYSTYNKSLNVSRLYSVNLGVNSIPILIDEGNIGLLSMITVDGKEWSSSDNSEETDVKKYKWSKQYSLDNQDLVFKDIDAVDSNHVWAAASSYTSEYTLGPGAIYFFDGNSWHKQVDIEDNVTSISAVDEDNVWAISLYESFNMDIPYHLKSCVYYFDGNSWEKQLELPHRWISSIHAYDDENVWAVGGYSAWHFDGSNWTEQEGVFSFAPFHVSVAGPENIWATGYADESCMYFFDGNTWKDIEPIRDFSGIVIIDAFNSNHIWLGDIKGDVYFFDGITAYKQGINTNKSITSICALNEGCVWVTGSVYNDDPMFSSEGNGSIFYYDGATWSNQFYVDDYLTSVSAIDEDHVWAASDKSIYFGTTKKEDGE